jgi:ribonucleoside-diphosphate reductase alpha chain
MHPDPRQLAPIAEEIWRQKYRLQGPDGVALDATIGDTWARVATAAAAAEPGGKRNRTKWAERFLEGLSDLTMLPAGRIIAGAGAGRQVTLFNCFVMGRIDDDLGQIFTHLREAALTLQQGGGIGHDFSTLRPRGSPVAGIGATASGPISFMDVWDTMCRTIMSAGARRGAMMATLRCDHPDIEDFIAAKSDPARLRNFNVSVLVTDALLQAVRDDRPFDLVFAGKVHRTVSARALWRSIMQSTYAYAEPGVIFIDRVNAMNNLAYCETIDATNPCGEQPLPPYGACLLGSINLARLIDNPFSAKAALDEAKLDARVGLLVRLLDNVIDVSGYPLPAQRVEAKAKRRLGIGVTGLANALAMVGARYGAPDAVALTSAWLGRIERAAYLASAELAAERGAFPLFDRDAMLNRPNIERLDPDVRAAIGRQGLRNGCLTSIAPTGTISLLAGNVSSGIEPVFGHVYRRTMLQPDGVRREETVEDYAHALWRRMSGADAPLPAAMVTSADLTPGDHLAMQAAVQRHVDSSISKTINCPAETTFEMLENVYLQAYDLGLKGCTTFRPNSVTGAVLAPIVADTAASTAMEDAGRVRASTTTPAPARASVAAPAFADPADAAAVVYLSKPLLRDTALPGYTYKLKWPGSGHAMYITINDIERDGRRRPFEIFINTKTLEHQAWTVALTRMISAVFRRGGDVSFVVEELKAVFDPAGGFWVDGRYVPSLIAAIGETIEAHMLRTGFLKRDAEPAIGAVGRGKAAVASEGEPPALDPHHRPSGTGAALRGDKAGTCGRCFSVSLRRSEGCLICTQCGYARCG